MPENKKAGIFYGYIVVGAGLIVSGLIIGTHNTFGVFLKPLSFELGLTRAATSAAFSLSFLIFGLSSIAVGRLTDRFGPKVVITACGLLTGLGYILMSQVTSLWQLYIFLGIIIGAGMSAGDTPVLATIARWFVKKRGMAIGISKVGVGIGILVMPPLASWLIINHGWRDAYVIIGLICLAGIISAAMFMKRDPAQIGQFPDGAVKQVETKLDVETRLFSLRQAIGTKQFWLFATSWFIVSFCAMIVLVHIAPRVTDIGISATVAATILGAIGGFSVVSRLAMGIISDRIGVKAVFIIGLVLLAASLTWVQYAKEAWMFYLFAAVYGIAHGTLYTVFTPLLAQLFGLRSIGAIVGVFVFTGTLGGSIGPILAGRIFDITNSYQLAFLLSLALSLIALVLMCFLRLTSNEAVTSR